MGKLGKFKKKIKTPGPSVPKSAMTPDPCAQPGSLGPDQRDGEGGGRGSMAAGARQDAGR